MLEVNERWLVMYCLDNLDCEEFEGIVIVLFGSFEIIEVKKVSFRDIIEDVYFIESKEEMKRLEELYSMGYYVIIKIFRFFICDCMCKNVIEVLVFEEKEIVLVLVKYLICDYYSDKIVLKKLVDVKNYEMGDVKIGLYEY